MVLRSCDAQGVRKSAQLLMRSEGDPRGEGTPGLYSLFWRLQGDACAMKTDLDDLVRGTRV